MKKLNIFTQWFKNYNSLLGKHFYKNNKGKYLRRKAVLKKRYTKTPIRTNFINKNW
jgi:hypothetical protein